MEAARGPRAGIQSWAGYAIGLACLVWVFHDVAPGEVLAGFAGLRWDLVALAIVADIASYAVQGTRWTLLLRPIAPLSVVRATQAIYAGLFTNEVIPLRVGEVLRAFLASQWLKIPVSVVASSIAAERFLDGIWLALTAGLLVLVVPLPRYLVGAEEILAAVIFAGILVFLWILRRRACESGPAPRGGRLMQLLDQFASALRIMGGSRTFYAAGAASALLLVLQVLAFWLVMEAYGLRLSVARGAAVLLILHLGTMVPGPPSNAGTYQFFTVVGLTIFGVDKTAATGFSLVVFLLLTIPLWLLGLLAFGKAGLDPRHIRKEVMGIVRRQP